MPVRTRRQRALAPSFSQLSLSSLPLSTNNTDGRRLADETVVNVTVSATGKGKHWRWVYPKNNTPDAQGEAVPDALCPSSNIASLVPQPQHGQFITPASSVQYNPTLIQNAPRKPEKHRPRPEGAPPVQRRPVQPELTIPWEKDLQVSKKRTSPKVGRDGQALGPHGTWLVDDYGKCIMHSLRKSPRVNKVGRDVQLAES